MSVFSPMSLGGPQDQKKALLERLMQQYQEAASRAAGLGGGSGMAGAAGATPFHPAHPGGGLGLFTHMPHVLPRELMAELGPGGIGVPSPGNSSQAPGQGISYGVGSRSGHGLGAGGPAHPIGPPSTLPTAAEVGTADASAFGVLGSQPMNLLASPSRPVSRMGSAIDQIVQRRYAPPGAPPGAYQPGMAMI